MLYALKVIYQDPSFACLLSKCQSSNYLFILLLALELN